MLKTLFQALYLEIKPLKSQLHKKPEIETLAILDLSSPNTRQKYLFKTKCLDFFSLQATAVDRCARALKNHPTFRLLFSTFLYTIAISTP